MENKIRITSLFTFIFVTSVSFAQYKYDIGLKASTYDLERYQLEQRFHFDSPWSITVTLLTGTKFASAISRTPTYSDSLFDDNYEGHDTQNSGIKMGVQRKLGLFATDVFYTGASLGFGVQNSVPRILVPPIRTRARAKIFLETRKSRKLVRQSNFTSPPRSILSLPYHLEWTFPFRNDFRSMQNSDSQECFHAH